MTSPTAPAKLRAALIGCGRIGAHTPDRLRATMPPGWLPLSHAEAMASLPELELCAVCDADETRAKETAVRYGVDRFYTDSQSMLAEVRPDVVSVATRTPGRCDIITAACAAGVRAIHAEKPLATSLQDCRRALAAVREHQVALTYGTTRRYMDIFHQARRMVQDGAIGPLVQITVELGVAPLLWSHPHSLDLLIFFAGSCDIRHVQSTCVLEPGSAGGLLVDCDPVVENLWVRFANGIHGTITTATGMNVRLAGKEGVITVAGDGGWLEWNRRSHPDRPYHTQHERFEAQPEMSGTRRAFQQLIAAVKTGAKTGITLEEIETGIGLQQAAVWSTLNQGRRVTLAEVPEELTVTGRTGTLTA